MAQTNLLSAPVLFFALGLTAALLRSDLEVPQAFAKAMSLYLLLAIGFKGGVAVASHGVDARIAMTLGAGLALSAAIPFIAFAGLNFATRLSKVDAAAVAAHYGSISVVTFAAATAALETAGVKAEGYMVAVAAVMETPAILSALWLIRGELSENQQSNGEITREIFLNGSIVLLTGAFIIGWIAGERGFMEISPFITDPFKGVLCLFLLDMGLLAGRGIRQSAALLTPGLIGFGFVMPLVGALMGALVGAGIGLSAGGIALLATLCGSASYIAVPAAMRLALPRANPSVYLTMSLGVTFPFNLTIGIPVYILLGELLGA